MLMVKIYLDAGHGGKDNGASGNGLNEKNVVLDLAKRVETKLKAYSNVQVLQTRTTDVFLELSERTTKANQWGADVFVSFHCNSAPDTSAKGFESFVYNGSIGPDTIAFQNVMHQEILRQIGGNVVDRGKKRANFHVLRESHMKAALFENLFVSNASDASLLKQTTFLDRLAQGYVTGLEKFFGLIKETRPPTETPPKTDSLYQVIAGTYSSRDNAEAQVKKLAADGYSAYIQEKE
jgi:N-acetylmuramoyl-L-alanine amidase